MGGRLVGVVEADRVGERGRAFLGVRGDPDVGRVLVFYLVFVGCSPHRYVVNNNLILAYAHNAKSNQIV